MSIRFHVRWLFYISTFSRVPHEIQSSFDYKPPTDVRAIFLDISKAFDKVWHQGLLLKLKSYGIESNLSRLLANYLHNWKQRVTHDSKCSSWKIILSDVFGPLQFLIDINDLSDGLISICNIFSEDMSIFSKVFYQDKSERDLNNDLFIISERASQWKIEFNPDPNK